MNVARIDSGGALNTVPDRAVLRFNVRVPDADAVDWVRAAVAAAVLAGAGDGIAMESLGGITRPPKPFTQAQEALFADLREVGRLIGEDLAWAPSGGVCEGNNLFAAGIPGIDTLGVCGGAIHSENEFAWPASFVSRAALSALFMVRLGGVPDDRRASYGTWHADPA